MEKWAKKDHKFTTRSGAAERSITFAFENKSLNFVFGLALGLTDAKWKKHSGVQYTTFLHEGTYAGYRKSKSASKSYTPTNPKTGYGIKADHFIDRAWDKYYGKMVDDIRTALKGELKK